MIEKRHFRHAIAGVHGCYASGIQFKTEVQPAQEVSRPEKRVQMTLRALAFALIGIMGATSLSAADGEGLWRTVAKAPRSALPDVEVTLGYRGPYIPTWNSPIVLRTAAHPHFNGHIGFRFAVGDKATRDLAVLSADRVERDKPWSFTTWARLKGSGMRMDGPSFNRELVIEWRSSDMKIIGKRSVGVPPWSVARPLLISQSAASGIRLGLEPVLGDPGHLPAVAQWYEGFSATIVAVDVWLDLPAGVREAIIGSQPRIVFVGFPRAGQTLSAADRALLPVEFRADRASYVMPWPARTAGTMHEATLQWAAKASATAVGDSSLPPLVVGQAAAWAASADLLEVPLPVVQIQPKIRYSSSDQRAVWRDVATEFRLPIAVVLTVILTVAAWFAVRRRPRTAIIVAVIACAAIPLAARQRLRPYAWSIRYEEFVDRGGGVLSHRVRTTEHAQAPLPAHPIDATLARTAVFAEETEKVAEIRASATPIGTGMMFQPQAGWDSAERIWMRREVGTAPAIRVVSAGPSRLVLDYDSRIASHYAAASWYANGRRCYGEARLPHPTKGRVTISNNEVFRPRLSSSDFMWGEQRDAVLMHLLQRNDKGWIEQWWAQPYRASDFRGRQFSISAQMVPTPDGRFTCSIFVPAGTLAADAHAGGFVWSDDEIATLSIATASGSWTVESKLLGHPRGQSSRGTFEIPAEALASVHAGGVIVITAVPAAAPIDRGGSASVDVRFQEKKS